jgi:hypothetical protein
VLAEAVDGSVDGSEDPQAQDELELWGYILAEHKLRSLAFLPGTPGTLFLFLCRPCCRLDCFSGDMWWFRRGWSLHDGRISEQSNG